MAISSPHPRIYTVVINYEVSGARPGRVRKKLSLGSRRFPVRAARDRYMGSKVGGASGRASGRTANTTEFRGGEAIRSIFYA